MSEHEPPSPLGASQRARDTAALGELKKLLNYDPSALASTEADLNGGNAGPSSGRAAAAEAYMLRFLRQADYALPETVSALRRRREFEHTFATFRVTPQMVGFLQSGDVAVLGTDRQRRPVLFLNYRSSEVGLLGGSDLQHMAVLLLEYLQSLCIDAATVSPGPRERSVSDNGLYSPASASAESTVTPDRQECVLVVKDEAVPRATSHPLTSFAQELAPTVAQYYPNLLAQVLVVQEEAEARRGMAAIVESNSARVRRVVRLVAPRELAEYIEGDLVPQELGGRRPARLMAGDFADAVLRHWYTLTALLQLERDDAARPWYIPTPHLLTSLGAVQRRGRGATSRAVTPGWGAVDTKPSQQQQGGPTTTTMTGLSGSFPSNVFTARSVNETTSRASSFHLDGGRHGSGAAPGTTTVDDGVCSALSMDDLNDDLNDDDDDHGAGRRCETNTRDDAGRAPLRPSRLPVPVTPRPVVQEVPHNVLEAAMPTAEERERVRGDGAYAVVALQQERARRMLAEQKLQLVETGIVLDPRHTSALERRLGAIHREMDVLVTAVVERGRTAAASSQAGPTLPQLYDAMLRALETTAGVSAPPQPTARSDVVDVESESSHCCCCVM